MSKVDKTKTENVVSSLVKGMVSARKEAKMTQTELAEKIGTTQSAIARLEAGRVSPSIATLQRYAMATGRSLHINFENTKDSISAK